MTIHEPLVDGDGAVRPTHVLVDHTRLATNFRRICDHVQRPVLPILKANAYGHGVVAVAHTMVAAGASMVGVAYLEEGILLRRAGISCDILVLGGILGSQVPTFLRHELVLSASSVDKVLAIEAAAAEMGRVARVHLKIDTGMERFGVHWYNAFRLIEAAMSAPHVRVEGVYSHLSASEDADTTALQLERFLGAVSWWAERGLPTPTRHLANSGAILGQPSTWLDLVRPGLLLYGVAPSPQLPVLPGILPALTWISRVVYFKVVPAGAVVSYGGRWTAQRQTRLVTVPVGYGDGYLRAMSGRAEVGIGGRRYPVVGTICMDSVVVDIGDDSAYNGDEVLLLGERGGCTLGAEELAEWAGTVPWEVLTAINTRVPRLAVGTPGTEAV